MSGSYFCPSVMLIITATFRQQREQIQEAAVALLHQYTVYCMQKASERGIK